MSPRASTPRAPAPARTDRTAGPRADFVRPKTAQQAVAEALRQDITTGRLPPGSWIVQESVAEQFGVSRIPIREALKTLEAEEYITYVPHSGYRVTKLSLTELTEVFRLRNILEEELIRDGMPRMTDEVVREMRACMAAMEAAAAVGDLVAVGIANRRFHHLSYQDSELERTKRIVNQLWNTADAYRPLYAHLMDLSQVNTEHRLIVDAIEARDIDLVVTLNHQHRAHSVEHLTQALRQEEEEANKP